MAHATPVAMYKQRWMRYGMMRRSPVNQSVLFEPRKQIISIDSWILLGLGRGRTFRRHRSRYALTPHSESNSRAYRGGDMPLRDVGWGGCLVGLAHRTHTACSGG